MPARGSNPRLAEELESNLPLTRAHGRRASGQGAAGRVSSAVLLCHGDADPFTPPAALEACVAQLRAARAPWQLHTYGGAPHAFTNPAQALNGKAGFGYDRAAAESSWHAAKGFLADLACGGIE